jgi:hypothetical protein
VTPVHTYREPVPGGPRNEVPDCVLQRKCKAPALRNPYFIAGLIMRTVVAVGGSPV